MALEAYQFEIQLDTIYELRQVQDLINFREPSMFVLGGTVDVYGLESDTPPASKSDLQLEYTSVSGHNTFNAIPRYFYIEEATATVSSVILTGVKPEELA